MMRFTSPPLLKELSRRLPLIPTVNKTHGWCTLAKCTFSLTLPPHLPRPLVRPLYTGTSVRKDVPKTELTKEKLDLDIWKSVMRSHVPVLEVKKQEGEEEDGNGIAAAEVSSPLEGTRELVVMWRHAGKLVPEHMTDEELGILAELQTKSSKKKYLKYLAIKEGHKKSRKEKQQKRKVERSERFVEDDSILPGGQKEEGGELKNTFLLQFWGRSLDKLLGWRSAQAMVFDQPLVFDMSYDQHMTRRELENTVTQLLEVEGWNRRASAPFHLHYCNLQPGGGYLRELVKRYGSKVWEQLFVTATERHHVDLFPLDDLVYLTADSPNVLRTFDHSKVYIVGSMVDRSIQTGQSLANAKRLKLQTARLPLDEFLQWEIGAKNLTLDQMIRILLKLKETGSWEEALEYVPKRKHDGFYQNKPQKNTAGTGYRDSDRNRGCSERGRDNSFTGGDRAFRSGDREKPFDRRDRDGMEEWRQRMGGGDQQRTWRSQNASTENRQATQTTTRTRPSLKTKMEHQNSSAKGRKKYWEHDEE